MATPPPLPAQAPTHSGRDERSAAIADIHLLVLDDHALLPLRLQLLQRQGRSLLDIQEPSRGVDQAHLGLRARDFMA